MVRTVNNKQYNCTHDQWGFLSIVICSVPSLSQVIFFLFFCKLKNKEINMKRWEGSRPGLPLQQHENCSILLPWASRLLFIVALFPLFVPTPVIFSVFSQVQNFACWHVCPGVGGDLYILFLSLIFFFSYILQIFLICHVHF